MTERAWDQIVRILIEPNRARLICMWTPPEPIMVQGLRFSQPTELREVHVGLTGIATDNREIVEGYPEFRLNLLDGAYTEWRAVTEYVLRVGEQLTVELATVYSAPGWVEPIYDYPAERAERQARAARRERQIAECALSLSAPLPVDELGGITVEVYKQRGPMPPRRRFS